MCQLRSNFCVSDFIPFPSESSLSSYYRLVSQAGKSLLGLSWRDALTLEWGKIRTDAIRLPLYLNNRIHSNQLLYPHISGERKERIEVKKKKGKTGKCELWVRAACHKEMKLESSKCQGCLNVILFCLNISLISNNHNFQEENEETEGVLPSKKYGRMSWTYRRG